MDGVLIAKMHTGGFECVLGATRDPEVGPVLLFGSGGVDLEIIGDAALAAPGLNRESALALIDRTRAGQITRGYRGRPALDRDALAMRSSDCRGLSSMAATDRIHRHQSVPFGENGGSRWMRS